MLSAGTNESRNRTSDCMSSPPMVCWIEPISYESRSTRNIEYPLSTPSTRARTCRKSANGAFEMKCFVPFSTNPPSTCFAVVSMAARSEPAFGSVRAMPVVTSPRISGIRYFSRWCSVPSACSILFGPNGRSPVSSIASWFPAHRATSSRTRHISYSPRPAPPTSSGMNRPW